MKKHFLFASRYKCFPETSPQNSFNLEVKKDFKSIDFQKAPDIKERLYKKYGMPTCKIQEGKMLKLAEENEVLYLYYQINFEGSVESFKGNPNTFSYGADDYQLKLDIIHSPEWFEMRGINNPNNPKVFFTKESEGQSIFLRYDIPIKNYSEDEIKSIKSETEAEALKNWTFINDGLEFCNKKISKYNADLKIFIDNIIKEKLDADNKKKATMQAFNG